MSDTLWCDLSAINARLSKLEARLDRIEKYTPAEVAAILEGLKCSLAVVERDVKLLRATVTGRGTVTGDEQ